MRSELVFGAMTQVQNRYLLARLTSKTTRIFHRPHSRLEETANDVLRLFSQANPQQGRQCPPSSSVERLPADASKRSSRKTPSASLNMAE